MTQCLMCKREFDGMCPSCPKHLVIAQAKLEVCRSGECGRYESERGKDRCLSLGKPCNLVVRLMKGMDCPKGMHDEIGDPPQK